MATPEDSKPDSTPLPPLNPKNDSFFNRLTETVLLLGRIDKDDAAKYYGDLVGECMNLYKPSLWELFSKGTKTEKLSNEERLNPENYESEDEKRVVECMRRLHEEKRQVFAGDYVDREECYNKCEAMYPKKTGSTNFIWRHSCKRECETGFTKSVKPKVLEVKQKRDEKIKEEKENIDV